MRHCSITNCAKSVKTKGLCNTHYSRLLRGSDMTMPIRRKTGGCTFSGYRRFKKNGVITREHTLIAEKALGKLLPKGAIVHHVDGNGINNANNNLVICPNQTYHLALHYRLRALRTCGNANWLRCIFCKQYDDPQNFTFENQAKRQRPIHLACRKERWAAMALNRKPEKSQ